MGGNLINSNFNYKPIFGEGNQLVFNHNPMPHHQNLPSMMMPGPESLNPGFNQYQQMFNYMQQQQQQLQTQPSPVSGDSNINRGSPHGDGSKNATFGSLNTSFQSDIYPNMNINNINNLNIPFKMDTFS